MRHFRRETFDGVRPQVRPTLCEVEEAHHALRGYIPSHAHLHDAKSRARKPFFP